MRKVLLFGALVLALASCASTHGIADPAPEGSKVNRFNGWEILPAMPSSNREYNVSLHCVDGTGLYQTYQREMGFVVIPNDPLCKK